MSDTTYHYTTVDGVQVFHRRAGSLDSPTVLLLHGFPSSSFQFRRLLTALSDQWHVVAPDMPGFGFTRLKDNAAYRFTFDNLVETVSKWAETLKLNISAVYLHDYGGHVGFRLLARNVIRPRAIIIQNTESYRGEGWRDPMRGIEARQTESQEEGRARLIATLINEGGIWIHNSLCPGRRASALVE